MKDYKCICCGATKESESSCSCPVCGYRMFEEPYIRSDMLRAEIASFISQLEVVEVTKEDLVFSGKQKDDHNFPDYDKILKYVSGKDKTEDFFECLLETASQLKMHFSTERSKEYPVLFGKLENKVNRFDEVLKKALAVIAPEERVELQPIVWDQTTLLYSETQNKYLWYSAEELLEGIEKLARKIVTFIKQNNLYGNIHKYYPEKQKGLASEKTNYKDELEKAIEKTADVLRKKYVVDIIEDGSEELKEMLTCLWNDIELIMCAPLHICLYEFKIEYSYCDEKDYLNRLTFILKKRYEHIDHIINDVFLAADKEENELFDIYKALVELDSFGFLVPVGTTLINIGESEKKLGELIGLSGIKESVHKIKAYALANKDSDDLNIHMCFLGNPGTGKTEVARYIAGILYENKILPTNKMIEVDRSGLVSQYFGATAEKTKRVIQQSLGGVLFVDEAYALGNNADSVLTDYGKEAIDTLVKAMEDYRGKFCVIFAGYRNEMLQMLSTNPGFQSRIQFTLDFPNYSRDELQSIAERMLVSRQYTIGDVAMNRVLDIADVKRKEPNFANAREIRNILDQVIMCQNIRCMGTEDKEIGIADVNKYISDAKINLPTSGDGLNRKIMTGEEELDQLIGLATVKRMIKKIKAYAKKNKGEADFNLHMCFYGNPGTGKTEVARILSRILYDAGVLDEAKLVETDGQGLLGRFVGETGPKTEAKINEAMNGVLFIDEAYSIVNSKSDNGGATHYGDEAIAVLLKEMEDHRGQFCVILAGYKDEMKTMLSANPGFESRIQFTLEFPDFSREELGEIAKAILRKKKYEIEAAALDRVLDIAEYFRKRPNFANARTVRNVLDQVIMNQNLRTEDLIGDNTIIVDDVEDYLTDEGIDLSDPNPGKRKIGFM